MALRSRLPLRGALSGAALLMLVTVAAAAAPDPSGARPVRVERVRPVREALPTLRFLKTNRDFFRSRLDLLREQPLAGSGDAGPLDPRFLAYGAMVSAARAGTDSVGAAAADREHRPLLESVRDFAQLEDELDQMDRLLAGQQARLTLLQADFTGRQRTALAVVLSGWPQGATLDSVSVRFDDGASFAIPLSSDDREALAHGGAVEVFHGLVEPREQVLELSVAGAAASAGGPAFVTLDPAADRLTFLRLDLSPLRAGSGAAAVLASAWLHDDGLAAADDRTSRP
jgi:hypothetical protein